MNVALMILCFWFAGAVVFYFITRTEAREEGGFETWGEFIKFAFSCFCGSWIFVLLSFLSNLKIPLQGKPPKWL